VAARLPSICLPTLWGYFGELKNLIELQHEYPGETFYLFDDCDGTVRERRNGSHTVVNSVCACLALGVRESKAVLCSPADIPQIFQALWTHRNIQYSEGGPEGNAGRLRESRRSGLRMYVTTSMLFGMTCVLLRATTMAATSADRAAYCYARRMATSFNAFASRNVLAKPSIRPVEQRPPGDCTRDAKADVCTFDAQPVLERKLLAMWADAQARNAGESARKAWIRLAEWLGMADPADSLFPPEPSCSVERQAARRLAAATEAHFAVAAEQYRSLLRRPSYILDILADGANLVREQAAMTLTALQDAVGES
jgi:hypothetical protein